MNTFATCAFVLVMVVAPPFGVYRLAEWANPAVTGRQLAPFILAAYLLEICVLFATS